MAEALDDGEPIALLVSTPAFCQIAICGPVLDVLLGVTRRPPRRSASSTPRCTPTRHEEIETKAPVVDELGLTFEPCLVLVGADGIVVERLDTIFDDDELDATPWLASLSLTLARADAQLKDLPQPQVRWAFGLLMANPAPWRPSL